MNKSLKQSLGIDVSKNTLAVCLGFLTNSLHKEFQWTIEVKNDLSGYEKLAAKLKKTILPEMELVVVMEATGVYHQGIAHYLHDLGFCVSILQSGRVKRYAQSLDQRSKTDALDSKMLSMLGLERELRPWNPPSDLLTQLKVLSRERTSLIKDKTMELNRQEALSASFYVHKKSARRHLQRVKLIEKQIAIIELEMEVLVAKDPILQTKIKYLMSIPGISFIAASTVVGETLGFDAIENAKQLTSYAGYDVVLRESGKYKGKSKISKKGNSHIRGVLHMPSMTCVRCNPTLKVFYQRLKAKKEKPLIALVAVQRKLLILMYLLWKNEQNYDPKYEQKKQQIFKDIAALDNHLNKKMIS